MEMPGISKVHFKEVLTKIVSYKINKAWLLIIFIKISNIIMILWIEKNLLFIVIIEIKISLILIKMCNLKKEIYQIKTFTY